MAGSWNITGGGGPGSRHAYSTSIRALATLVIVAALLGGSVLLPTSAAAEPACTNTWTGPAEGTWQTVADWSAGHVPNSTDVSCIGSGKTVKVTEGTDQTGLVQGEGTVAISGGTLEVATTSEVSSLHSLTMSGGTLSGAGKLSVSATLSWTGGTMSGTGSTVLGSGVTTSLSTAANFFLGGSRILRNEGSLSLLNGALRMSGTAHLQNTGTLKVNAVGGFVNQSGTPLIINSGTFERLEGSGVAEIPVSVENLATLKGNTGGLSFETGATVTLASGSTLEGAILLHGAAVNGASFNAANANVTLSSETLSVTTGATATIGEFSLTGGTVSGAGTLDISKSLSWSSSGRMAGTGTTVLAPGATGSISSITSMFLSGARSLVNEGTLTFTSGQLWLSETARLFNGGTFKANSESGIRKGAGTPAIVNTGTFEKTEGAWTTAIVPRFESLGAVSSPAGHLEFAEPIFLAGSTQYGGGAKPSAPGHPCPVCGDPVTVATGNLSESQTDLSVGGRGVGLSLTRTYNSQAGAEGSKGIFGYGWTSSFGDHLAVNKTSKVTTLFQADGSTVAFIEGSGGAFTPPAWTQDTLSGTEATGYTLTLASQVKYKFAGSSGRLESVTDRDGNATTLAYSEAGRLESITDPTSRKLTLAYNGSGLVESVKDPMAHTVKYTYEAGNLKTVTRPAEEALRWQFKYDASHQLTELTDGRSGKTLNEYNASHQVIKQTDPAGRELGFAYEAFHTTITNKTTGSITDEHFTSNDEPYLITRGFGTASATSESLTYNAGGYITSVTDGNEHTTTYEYDASGNRTKMVDPNKNETKWTYDATRDVETMTTPKAETTTIKREAHGNPETIERPAPGSTTQTTKYKYKATGELESREDPLKRVWKYEYDGHGNRTAELDPLTDKRTWAYNEDSQVTATVSPRGNVTGGKPAEFTTKLERDSQGRPVTVTDPLGHTVKYTYDGDGNVETLTDGAGHTTNYTYNADNQPVKVEAPHKTLTETEYDGAGQVIGQTDATKNVTKYKRNAVEEVIEATDPLGRVTKKEYDAAGNLKSLEDAAKRITTYKYDAADRLTDVSYSSGKPASISYEYDQDGDRTKMVDGTGTTKYTYDQLDRLTESEDGHKELSKYEYDLADQKTKITYPNAKSVTRAFDEAGRLEKVTDWSANVTRFTYNPDSQQSTTLFPSATKVEDQYAFDDADQMTEAKMLKLIEGGSETLASLAYVRDNNGQVEKTTTTGLPGAEIVENAYDASNRLTISGSEYKYDSANNPTTIGAGTYKYDKANQLETGPSLTYAYDELGERTKATPSSGPATTYGYDQVGNLTSVERAKEGEVSEIKDTYAYDGRGLRASQTISGTTTNLAWDMTESVPSILSDETESYIYGPGGIPVEQISGGGTVTYLHHDQAGSSRLLTGSTGVVTGKCTYGAYGAPTCEGATTTALGYDAQYTSSDTGLIYLRARTYDPTTAQFLSVDPLAAISGERYGYAGDNPLTHGDSVGLMWTPLASGAGAADLACGATVEVPGVDVATCGAAGLATAAAGLGAAVGVLASVAGEEEGDEGEAEVKRQADLEGCPKLRKPGSKFEWRGGPDEGGEEGSFFDPETDEYLRSHLKPSSHGPHYDYRSEDGTTYRLYPDGRIEPKLR
jgi:RHS repeat-associated protein